MSGHDDTSEPPAFPPAFPAAFDPNDPNPPWTQPGYHTKQLDSIMRKFNPVVGLEQVRQSIPKKSATVRQAEFFEWVDCQVASTTAVQYTSHVERLVRDNVNPRDHAAVLRWLERFARSTWSARLAALQWYVRFLDEKEGRPAEVPIDENGPLFRNIEADLLNRGLSMSTIGQYLTKIRSLLRASQEGTPVAEVISKYSTTNQGIYRTSWRVFLDYCSTNGIDPLPHWALDYVHPPAVRAAVATLLRTLTTMRLSELQWWEVLWEGDKPYTFETRGETCRVLDSREALRLARQALAEGRPTKAVIEFNGIRSPWGAEEAAALRILHQWGAPDHDECFVVPATPRTLIRSSQNLLRADCRGRDKE